MALTISLLALLATFFQLHVQRVHNEKSLKPLAQIDLVDRDKLAVHIYNNGVGPLIVEKITYLKEGKTFDNLPECIKLEPKSFQHLTIYPKEHKIIQPGSFLDVFSKRIKEENSVEEINDIRNQLASVTVRMDGKDIYNNKVFVERSLKWFSRHS